MNSTRIQFTKTDFLQFLNCPKSLWIAKNEPDLYPDGEFSHYTRKIAAEGYEVEDYVRRLLKAKPDAQSYAYQSEFWTERGLYARADVIRRNEDGTINIYEVKSSTKVKKSTPNDQIIDAAFQKVAAEETGRSVAKVFIVHLNGDYVRNGKIEPEKLLVFEDVTDEVAKTEDSVRASIEEALAFLKLSEIDQSSCTCLTHNKSNRCDTFEHFNPGIPNPSIYDLPRISKSKLVNFVDDRRFSLSEIALDEVSKKQSLVLESAHLGKPLIDRDAIACFFSNTRYPVYFLDYETFSSAIPLINGARPQAPIPFQYSLHAKRSPQDEEYLNFEYLAEEAVMPLALVEHMQKHIGPEGSVVSWHASYENTQNKNMAALYPEKTQFLKNLIKRTVDLENLFKEAYVDIAFGGSTSIKKVLPVLVPEFTYEGMSIASGTEAMEAWARLINMPNGREKEQLRKDMLEYCQLDTLAMVKIFEKLLRYTETN